MALRPDQIERWVGENGPWLYRRCSEDDAARILAGTRGIEPSSHPRPDEQRAGPAPCQDCAYIGTVRYLESDCPLRIDIRRLDPDRLVVDEDQVALHAMDFRESIRPPRTVRGTLGEWIAQLDLDDPENVWLSLSHGSIGVRGGVPREAIEPA